MQTAAFFSLLLPNLMKKIPKNIGKKIHLNEKCIVKGVVKNIYYNAPIHPVTPAIFFLPDNKQKSESRGHLIFKFKEGTWKNVSQKLREEAYKVNPNAELRLINMEEKYDEYMKSENSLNMLLSIVSFMYSNCRIRHLFFSYFIVRATS